MRSYQDLCGIARALDVVGERWALLVVRELLFGPKRFADLHRGLPGMSPNVLTQRLRQLEQSGILTRRRALQSATGLVYELTDRGRALEPALLALGRWGSSLAPGPGSATVLSPDALMVALRTTFEPALAADLQGIVQVRLPADAFVLTVRGGLLDVVRGEAAAGAVLTCSVRTVQDLAFDGHAVEAAVRTGEAVVDGDRVLLEHLFRAFDDHRVR
ncbi:winged helix-turn-helix transcriptional regulator [Occultella gossypii]|uniref:Winged helix-turn-helix transcriptional regulator n=1 Tax=Occultella gossypii TaxID=2800820 RepID=A0ABS7SBT5_9MICO|nr:winged helix-turn-helix transcriptional regulator [Occultella gossypii]MBZ2197547.1 winged helix-turn-helix transcriptional regulator [Occultella gossypii]